jgi:signal transduction histidine kinase
MAPMFPKLYQVVLAILVLLCASVALSAPPHVESGLPYVRYYPPKAYHAQGQVWAAAQDGRGIMYFANNDGILEYDGVTWRLIPVTAGSAVRSIGIDPERKIWVGARGDFGYLEPDPEGRLRFHSLLDRIPAEDRALQDVWSTIVSRDAVYFSSFQRVIIVPRSSQPSVIRPKSPVTRLFLDAASDNAKIYAHQVDRGLVELRDGQLVPVPGGDEFAKGRIGCVVPAAGNRLLVATREAIYSRDGDRFVLWPNEAAALLRESQIYSCVRLFDNSIAFATLRRGAFILGPDGKLLRRLDKQSGIPREIVAAIFQDREGGLWLGTDSGIVRVEVPSPLTFFDDRSGLKDTVVALSRSEGIIYAGTLTGLFRQVPWEAGMPARFEPVASLPGQTYDLLPTERGLLVGGGGGVKQMRGASLRQVVEVDTVYDLCRSVQDPASAFAMGPFGLIALRLENGEWVDKGKVAGIRKVLRRCAEDTSGRIWLGTDFQGVLRLDPKKDPPAVEEFAAQSGLPGGWTYPFRVAGNIVFTSRTGILEFDESSRRFVPSKSLAHFFPPGGEQPLLLTEDSRDQIWVGAKSYSGVIRSEGGSYRFDPAPLRRAGLSEIIAFHADPEGTLWVGSAEGIVRLDPSVVKPDPELPVTLRSVSSLRDGSLLFGGFSTGSESLTLPFRSNAVRFEFAAPSFDDEAATEYRFYLHGSDTASTPWMREPRKDFTNIPEGKYQLEVEARNIHGNTGKLEGYPFVVLPPWYRTFWAYLAYGCALIALVWGLVQWRLHQLNEQNRRLQQLVEQRTEEIRHKQAELENSNQQLVSANEELVRLNGEKNEFMGIAAHDLKNPLGAIRGYAEMLQEDGAEMDASEVQDAASRIQRSAEVMFSLVSNLLDSNRIERGLVKSEIVPCDLGSTARRVAEGYRERAEAKGITIDIDIPEVLPPALADIEQLGQVLDNLISNAVKYSPLNKPIYIAVHPNGSSMRFSVRDEGPGLTAEDRKRLFVNFARLSAKPTAGEHSTGLGLAIVKRLTEQMGGRVWCESEPGNGATFLLELPAAKVSAGAV